MKESKITSTGFLIGLFILLLNDLYLKEIFGNWFTGKLSDFAGLFIFPLFLSLFNSKRIWVNYIFSAVFFVFWKSDLSTGSLTFMNHLFHTTFSRVVDYSDLIALSVLPFSYWYSGKAKSLNFRFLKPVIVCISVFSFYATSAPDMASEDHTRLTGRYHKLWNYDSYNGKGVLEIGFQSKNCKSCYGIVIGPDIIAYGYNDDFILAKINPAKDNKIDTTKTEYSILVVSKDSTDNFGDKEVYKGLSEKDFLRKRKELNVPDSVTLKIR